MGTGRHRQRTVSEESQGVKPEIPTIVFVKAGDRQQEIAARSLGVSAVLTDDSDDDLFRETVASVLGLKRVVSIKSPVSAHDKKIDFEGIAG